MPQGKISSLRLEYLDWVRGAGAIIMLQGHVFHSFLRPELKTSGAYTLSQFLGGLPPALFLFLTGITLAFLMHSVERKGWSPRKRVWESLLRSRYLFFLAFAFRLQLWIFGLPAPWQGLFKVDVLNCMGLSIALLSVMAIFTTAERVRLCAVLGLAIAFLSPVISEMDWSGVPWILRDYIIPDRASFGIFPWAAYLAFGVSAGSVIRLVPPDATERCMQWAAILGGALILSSQYFAASSFTLYANSDFWLNSPAQVFTKVGVLFVMLAMAFLWTRYGACDGWSWVRQFGVTSLLVYWVHIELVYGKDLFFLQNSLNVAQSVVAAVCVILLMLAISTMKTHPARWKAIWASVSGGGPTRQPAFPIERASGD